MMMQRLAIKLNRTVNDFTKNQNVAIKNANKITYNYVKKLNKNKMSLTLKGYLILMNKSAMRPIMSVPKS